MWGAWGCSSVRHGTDPFLIQSAQMYCGTELKGKGRAGAQIAKQQKLQGTAERALLCLHHLVHQHPICSAGSASKLNACTDDGRQQVVTQQLSECRQTRSRPSLKQSGASWAVLLIKTSETENSSGNGRWKRETAKHRRHANPWKHAKLQEDLSTESIRT
jgi:hypothetical protein